MKIYPNSAEPARCKLCLQSIAWILTFPNRQKCPVDRPLITKNLEFDADGHEIAELVSPTHFDTCPEYDREKRQPKPKPKPIAQASLLD